MYDNGYGVPADEKKAFEYFLKAANSEEPYAMGNVGYTYANGEGVKRDDEEAVRWYRRAKEARNRNAINNLGFMYEKGRRVQKDKEMAVALYREAAEMGNPNAQRNLGVCLMKGDGVKKDLEEAYYWLYLASLSPEAEDNQKMARLHLRTIKNSGKLSASQMQKLENQAKKQYEIEKDWSVVQDC